MNEFDDLLGEDRSSAMDYMELWNSPAFDHLREQVEASYKRIMEEQSSFVMVPWGIPNRVAIYVDGIG